VVAGQAVLSEKFKSPDGLAHLLSETNQSINGVLIAIRIPGGAKIKGSFD
jgi:hypothetical protein